MSEGQGPHITANIGGNNSGQIAVGSGITQNWIQGPKAGPTAKDDEGSAAPPVKVKVFISYRRDDADGHAGRMSDTLVRRFGKEQVFLDVAGIDPGEDFVDKLGAKVGECDVLLAIMGRHWLTVADADGRRRLDDPDDWVRLEIRLALERKVTVVPVLVSGARMPGAADLPDDIDALARRNAIQIGPQWDSDVARLGDAIEKVARARQEASAAQ